MCGLSWLFVLECSKCAIHPWDTGYVLYEIMRGVVAPHKDELLSQFSVDQVLVRKGCFQDGPFVFR